MLGLAVPAVGYGWIGDRGGLQLRWEARLRLLTGTRTGLWLSASYGTLVGTGFDYGTFGVGGFIR